MKRKTQSIKLHKETLYRLTSTELGWAVGGLRSVRAGCLTDQNTCGSCDASCPTTCLTDHCNTRTLC